MRAILYLCLTLMIGLFIDLFILWLISPDNLRDGFLTLNGGF